MKYLVSPLIWIQRLLLHISYLWHRITTSRENREKYDWVVGATEVASMVRQIASAIPKSYSVTLAKNPFYSTGYDFAAHGTRLSQFLVRNLYGPILLGKLSVQAKGFVYVAANGFLNRSLDERRWEFRFLKRRGRKIAVYWCGSEIRSPKLMKELEAQLGLPNIFTYVSQYQASYDTENHEAVLKRRAEAGNELADVMFDAPTDQRSYLEGHREPFFLFMPKATFETDFGRFRNLRRPIIVHAASNPIIKGTQLVRAAIAQLKEENYEFEYVELIGVDHEKVLDQLRVSHIALNQFFGFTTAVFGAEALAAGCVVLSSADETIEKSLAPGHNKVSFVTRHWQIHDHLKQLLDNPKTIEPLARAGQEWAQRFVSIEGAGQLLQEILDSVLEGTYDKAQRALLSNEEIYGVKTARGGEPA